jgi:REP element-mobilizing transposase RayT
MVTRRCIERRYMLRPDAEVRAAMEYLAAVAVARYGMELIGMVVMSNHYHLILHDVHGRYPAFLQWFDSLVARVVNCRRGRWGRFWDGDSVHVEHLLTAEAVERKLVYLACNPMRAGLVERGADWPGVRSSPQVWVGSPKVVSRPTFFFRRDGVMPETAELVYSVPPTHRGMTAAEFSARIARRVSEEEERLRAEHAKAGGSYLGARGVLRQRWTAVPRTPEVHRQRKPLVAGDGPSRSAALEAIRLFRWGYADALDGWRAGDRDIVFPAGTWRMRVLHGAGRHPPPGPLAVLSGFRAPPTPEPQAA